MFLKIINAYRNVHGKVAYKPKDNFSGEFSEV